ncbi:MAG: hypothetical protein ACRDZY_19645, partial [Acidimicrobiales bacterium]
MHTATAFFRAVGGVFALAAILAGAPAAFWTFRATVIPSHVRSLTDLLALLTERDTGQVFLTLLVLVGVVAWLQLVAAIVLETTALLRRRPVRRLRGLAWAQKLAAGVLLLMLTGTAAATAAEPSPQPPAAVVTAPAPPA